MFQKVLNETFANANIILLNSLFVISIYFITDRYTHSLGPIIYKIMYNINISTS